MGLFVLTNTRTCFRYLPPLFGHLLPHYRQGGSAVLQSCTNPHVQAFCTRAPRHRSAPFENRAPSGSVFASGNSRRTGKIMKMRAGESEEELDMRSGQPRMPSCYKEIPDRPLSVEEWRKLRDSSPIPKHFEPRLLDQMVHAGTNIDVAKSLLVSVTVETGTVPYLLLMKYLVMCVMGGHDSEVLDTYDVMRRCFKSLDPGACAMLIKGLSRTRRWKEALLMLEEIKKVVTPTVTNYQDAITGALLHGDHETGWMLYDDMIEQGLVPNQETLRLLFSSEGAHQYRDKLLDILIFMRENQLYPDLQVAESIKTWFESLPDEQWTGRYSSVDSSRQCSSCQAQLESIKLTEEEYFLLKHRVLKEIIEGKDVFNKTTPQELENFKTFVKNSPVFDVIVDGLNTGNFSKKHSRSHNLLSVVLELKNQGLNTLVLGRKHMLRNIWKDKNMNMITKSAYCFFTDNISSDDIFLLYAALHSGNHCKFVSRDMMRDHKANLADSVLRRLFLKWQRGHQMVVTDYTPDNKVQFQMAFTYDTIVQSTDTAWHIPYDTNERERKSFEVPVRWLCLTKQC